MALGYVTHYAGDNAIAWSGGSEPAHEINPAAIAAMAEVGIGITGEYPKPWTEEIVRAADVVITMGCGDARPIFPGNATRTGNSQTRPAKVSTPSGPSATTFEKRVHRLLAELNVPEPDDRENPREHRDMTATTSESAVGV